MRSEALRLCDAPARVELERASARIGTSEQERRRILMQRIVAGEPPLRSRRIALGSQQCEVQEPERFLALRAFPLNCLAQILSEP